MPLDIAAVLTCVVLQQAPGVVERIAQRDEDIHVSFMLCSFAAHDDFIAWHGQVDLHIERCAFVPTASRPPRGNQ